MKYVFGCKAVFLGFGIAFISVVISCTQERTAERKAAKMNAQTNAGRTTTIEMSVEGMSCMACVASVKRTIEDLEGVLEAAVSLEDRKAIVTCVNGSVRPEKIEQAINEKGFKARKPGR